MTAWLHVQRLLNSGNHNTADITAEVKSVLFKDVHSSSPHQATQFIEDSLLAHNSINLNRLETGSTSSTLVRDEFDAYAKRKVEDG